MKVTLGVSAEGGKHGNVRTEGAEGARLEDALKALGSCLAARELR